MKKVLLIFAFLSCMGGLTAQNRHDGFFRSNDDFAGNRYNESSLFSNRADISITGDEIYNETFGEVPLGGGLLIMLSAGVGYALIKRRNSLKTK